MVCFLSLLVRLEPLPARKIDANAQYVGPPAIIRTKDRRCDMVYLQPQRKAPGRTRLHKTGATISQVHVRPSQTTYSAGRDEPQARLDPYT
jgi:hypothetical protein